MHIQKSAGFANVAPRSDGCVDLSFPGSVPVLGDLELEIFVPSAHQRTTETAQRAQIRHGHVSKESTTVFNIPD